MNTFPCCILYDIKMTCACLKCSIYLFIFKLGTQDDTTETMLFILNFYAIFILNKQNKMSKSYTYDIINININNKYFLKFLILCMCCFYVL